MVYAFSGEQIAAANRAAARDDAEADTLARLRPVRALTPAELVSLTDRVAARAALEMIESFGHKMRDMPSRPLYDLRPMIDERHWDPATLIEHQDAITLAFELRLIVSEPHQPGMVRITAPTGV